MNLQRAGHLLQLAASVGVAWIALQAALAGLSAWAIVLLGVAIALAILPSD